MSSSATPELAARIAQRYDALRASDDYHYLTDRLVVAGGLAQQRVLPFADGSFERATMVSVAHHLDRPRAFSESRRVLSPGGRLAIANADREMWLMRWFPELRDRELARFPDADDFAEELSAAGFEPVDVHRVAVPRRFEREQALEKIRGRHISSFDLLTDGEYRAGLARAERELRDMVEYTLRSLFVVAVRPAL